MTGIVGFGAYLPRLRLSRASIYEANKWFAPGLKGKAKGTKALANWDEDVNTMAVEACRNIFGGGQSRETVGDLYHCSTTHPFADRLNAGILKEALRLADDTNAFDMAGSAANAVNAAPVAMASAKASGKVSLVVAADSRRARAASAAELSYGDGAGALAFGADNVLAEILSHSRSTIDFVDQFRQAGEDINYEWEERWVRDEGVASFVPKVITDALSKAGLDASAIDKFVFPVRFTRMDAKIAKMTGIDPERIAAPLHEQIGDTGAANTMIHLVQALEEAGPGETILAVEFGGGASATILRMTERCKLYAPLQSVSALLERGKTEENYTKFLSFKGQLDLDKGMRGEQDRKAALSTLYRHRKSILGFVAGRCRETGSVSFPPTRFSYDLQGALLDTQEDYPLADRRGRVLSCSAEALSYYPAPPHQYGQVDFDGGGRVLMEFTDIDPGDIEAGAEVEMVFRVKDRDERRNFTRYFWKATPLSH